MDYESSSALQPDEVQWRLVRERERFLVKELLPTQLLTQCACLTDQDREHVQADERNYGPIHASTTLLQRLQRRGPQAFRQFVSALRKNGFEHTAQILDPNNEITDGPFTDSQQAELVCIRGDVTDIRVEVDVKHGGTEAAFWRLISEFYNNSKKDEIQNLRGHFTKHLDQDVFKHYMTFVKIIKTTNHPFVLVFRLSNQNAAVKLWDNFETGALASTVKECFRSSEVFEKVFQNNRFDITVNIDKDEYDKVINTLRDSKHVAIIDGEEKRDFSLEEFQHNLARPVLEGENAIICSPTGSGKTFVAMEVMKKLLKSEKRKKIIFIVNNVSLVQQQRQRCDTYLPEGVRVSSLCGNSIETLGNLLRENDVVVLTAKVLVNALEEHNVAIQDFCLLVFDECHHTKGKDPYNEIMWWYFEAKNQNPTTACPQVLGLSASLGIGTGNQGNATKAEDHIFELCANLDAQSLQDSNRFQTLTDTTVRPVTPVTCSVFQTVVHEAMAEIMSMLCLPPGRPGCLEKPVLPPGSQAFENWIVTVQKENLGRDAMTCAEHLNEYNNALMINEEVRSKDALCYLERHIAARNPREVITRDPREVTSARDIHETSTRDSHDLSTRGGVHESFTHDVHPTSTRDSQDVPTRDQCETSTRDQQETYTRDPRETSRTDTEQELARIYNRVHEAVSSQENQENSSLSSWLQELEQRLLEKFRDDVTSKGIIFVRTRLVASALVDWIKDSAQFKTVRPSYIVGCGQNSRNDEGMTKGKQDEEIKKFREGTCNVIVATATLLEGIDIPDCNFVINYGMPGNEITLVQARGRVRAQGTYEIIVRKENKMLKERDLEKERVMREAVEKVKKMPLTEFQDKINCLQKLAYDERLRMQEQASRNERKISANEQVKLFCKKCDTFALRAQDVKLFCQVHHIVPNHVQTMAELKIVDSTPRNIHSDISLIAAIYCRQCNQKWGSMSRNKFGVFPILKIERFRVRTGDECNGQVYRNWKEFPFELEKFDGQSRASEAPERDQAPGDLG